MTETVVLKRERKITYVSAYENFYISRLQPLLGSQTLTLTSGMSSVGTGQTFR
jgi:hypothetical protein